MPSLYDHLLHPQQTLQNTALRIATGCSLDTKVQDLHDRTTTMHTPETSCIRNRKKSQPRTHADTPLPYKSYNNQYKRNHILQLVYTLHISKT